MQQTTIASNTAGKRGGGLMIMTSGSGAVTINGSLFANTIAPSGGGGNIDIFTGSIAIAGSNNLYFRRAPPPSDAIDAILRQRAAERQSTLTPLGNFGGTTQTRVPMAGSGLFTRIAPVSGQCPVARDQRYVLRPQGPGCDIGAVEYDNDVIFVNGFDPQ